MEIGILPKVLPRDNFVMLRQSLLDAKIEVIVLDGEKIHSQADLLKELFVACRIRAGATLNWDSFEAHFFGSQEPMPPRAIIWKSPWCLYEHSPWAFSRAVHFLWPEVANEREEYHSQANDLDLFLLAPSAGGACVDSGENQND